MANPSHPRRRAAVVLLLGSLAATLIAVLGLAGPASAHAVLVTSTPPDGARIQQEPGAVRLTFDEPVGLIRSAEQVISTATGSRAGTGAARLSPDGTTIILPLKPDLPAGSYTATWRVVSADTHIVDGSITFGLRADPSAPPAASAQHTRTLDIADNVAQGVLYSGIVLLIGINAAARALWPWAITAPRARRAAWAGWGLMLAATAITLLLTGPRVDNASWAAVVRLRGIDQTLSSTAGKELIARVVLLILAMPLLAARARSRRYSLMGGAVALLLLIDTASAGHEAVGDDVALALPAAVLHLTAMAVWLGGLSVLALVVLPDIRHGGIRGTVAGLQRWSYTAYWCVAVLVVTGEYQAARQIGPFQALWSTSYGLTLLIKVAIVAVILVAALIAQRRVLALKPAPTGTDITEPAVPLRAARNIARSVRVEAALGVAVIAATALLVSQPPARTTYGPAVNLTVSVGNDRAHIHIGTTRRGREHLTVDLTDIAGKPVTAQSVTAQLSSSDIAALNVTMTGDTPTGTGWRSDVAVPLPGIWTLTLTVTLDPIDAYTTAIHYQVR